MHRVIASLAVLAVSALAVPALAENPDEELPGVGAEAPGFTLPVYNPEASGQPRAGTMLLVGEDAEDTAAKVVLVSFMASYCKPCKKELPYLQQLHERYQGKGLRIIGVAIDSEAEGQKLVGELLREAKVSYPVVKDQYNFVARRYLGTKVPLPSVFILDKTGKIGFVSRGYNEEISQSLTSAVQKTLGVAEEPIVAPGAKEPAASSAEPKQPPAKKTPKAKGKEKK